MASSLVTGRSTIGWPYVRASPCTPDRAHVGEQHDRELPDVPVQPGGRDLLAGDGVGLAQDVEPLGVDRTDDADGQAGAGERMPPHHRRRQPQLLADVPDLVLEQGAERLDEAELQVVGQPPDVVVALDVGRALAAAGLDDVGVEGALDEELDRRALGLGDDLPLGRLEHADELAADDLALELGVGDVGEEAEEPLLRVDDLEIDAGGLDEVPLDLLGLPLPQQPVVDEHAGQLVADRPLDQRRSDRGVDPARQPADDPLVADLLADELDLLLDDVGARPRLGAAGDVDQEVLEHRLPVLAVHDLRVPLDAGEPALDVLERGHRGARRPGVDGEPVGRRDDLVAVRHPRRQDVGKAGEEGARLEHRHGGAAVLTLARAGDVAAERLGHRHEAVADAEDRDRAVDDGRIELRRPGLVDARRAAGEDDRGRLAGQHLGGRHGVRDDLGVHLRLAHATGDELGVLSPEIDDENGVMIGVHGSIVSARK